MPDDIGFIIFYTIAELLHASTNCILRKMGYSEVSVKKLSVILGWIFVFLFIGFLLWLTIAYS